jgi:hypothetical protein
MSAANVFEQSDVNMDANNIEPVKLQNPSEQSSLM